MQEYIFLRVRKDYASDVIKDLEKMHAVELLGSSDTSVPQWQKDEVRARLVAMNEGKDPGLDWETAMARINGLTK